MAFKVHVGPPQITVHQGQAVLVSELDGQINWPSEKGLYFLDTRMISSWAIYANGEQFELLTGGPVSSVVALAFSPDGKRLAVARWNGLVQLWDPAKGAIIHTLEGHARTAAAVAFSRARRSKG